MKINNTNTSSHLIFDDSKQLFEALFNQQLEFIAILSPEGRVLKVNDLALISQGAKREDYVGKLFWHSPAWSELPEWEGIWKQRLIDASKQQEAIITEDVFQVEDGSTHYADASTMAVYSANGEVSGYIIQAIDTTKRRIREDQIEESDARMKLVLAHSQIGHWELNLKDHTSHRSLKHDQIFGYETLLPEWNYKIFLEHVILEERAEINRQFQKIIKNKSDWNFECRIQRKDGEIRWILASGGHLFDLHGKTKVIAGVVQDITEIKKAALIKLRHNAELQSLFNALPDTYFRLKPDGTIIDHHTQNQDDLYIKPDDFLGKRVQDILPKNIAELFVSKVDELHKVNHSLDFKYQLIINKEVTYFEARLNKIPDNSQIICVIRNVTEEFKSKQSLAIREQFFRSIFEQVAVGIALVNANTGEFIRVNERYCDMLGYSIDEMVNGKTFQEMTHPDDLENDVKYFEKVRQGTQEKFTREKRYIHKDGHVVWVELSASPAGKIDGQPNTLVAVVMDIDERKKSEEKLLLASRVISNTREGIIITDSEQVFVEVNPAFTRITGYSSEEVIGQRRKVLFSDRQTPQLYEQIWQTVEKEGAWQGELWCKAKQGNLYAILLTISALKNDAKETTHFVSVFSDITNNKRQQEHLNLMAHYDVLTKLPNRALFIDRFQQSIAHSKRTGFQFAVCFLDLDDFKPVNDNFGHDIGDRLLIEVAHRITACIRKEDTVSRQGGDEFAILLNDIKSMSQYENTIKRIHEAVAEPYLIDGIGHSVTASSGVTLYPTDDGDIDTLLRHADHAMYQSKLAGKHRSQLYSLDLDRGIINKNHQLEEIKKALINHEFELYYQPKVNMATGDIIGAEALIRWNHAQKGIVPPLAFLNFTDGTTLEIKIGEWVIKEALKQLDSWQKQGVYLELSVNISSNHLLSTSFVDQLENYLANYSSDIAQYLQLEVLESSAFGDINTLNHIVEICQNTLGVSFALDDFGTGYSSLTHLRRLPVNTIKIDQSFVRDMLDDPNDYTIVEGVISLSKLFKRKVIAEGVETSDHGLMLLLMGCEQAQGYEIAKPMQADHFIEWLHNFVPNEQWLFCGHTHRTNKEIRLAIFRMINDKWVENFKTKLTSLPSENKLWPILDHELCQCGSWIQRETQEQLFSGKALRALDKAHDKLHFVANAIQEKYQKGDIADARKDVYQLDLVVDEMKLLENNCK